MGTCGGGRLTPHVETGLINVSSEEEGFAENGCLIADTSDLHISRRTLLENAQDKVTSPNLLANSTKSVLLLLAVLPERRNMSSTTTTTERLTLQSPPTSTTPLYGKLRYVASDHIPEASPHNFHLPAMSEFGDIRRVALNNMRPVPTVDQLPHAAKHAQLATHGFTAVHHPTTLNTAPHTSDSMKDPDLLKQHYIPETIGMLKQITGCRNVVPESLLLRSALWSESDALATHAGHGDQKTSAEQDAEQKRLSELETSFPQFIGFNPKFGGASPAPKIHLDYSPVGARTHIRCFHPGLTEAAKGVVEVEDRLAEEGKGLEAYKDTDGPRWALFSIWRPLKKVKRDPLALGDQRTFKPEDYVEVMVKTPYLGREEMEGETHDAASYLARWSEGHEWFWIEGQEPEEVLVIGLFDSAMEGVNKASGGTLHSSVELEGAEDEEVRESLELRCLAVW